MALGGREIAGAGHCWYCMLLNCTVQFRWHVLQTATWVATWWTTLPAFPAAWASGFWWSGLLAWRLVPATAAASSATFTREKGRTARAPWSAKWAPWWRWSRDRGQVICNFSKWFSCVPENGAADSPVDFASVGHMISQHIVGMNPTCVGKWTRQEEQTVVGEKRPLVAGKPIEFVASVSLQRNFRRNAPNRKCGKRRKQRVVDYDAERWDGPAQAGLPAAAGAEGGRIPGPARHRRVWFCALPMWRIVRNSANACKSRVVIHQTQLAFLVASVLFLFCYQFVDCW